MLYIITSKYEIGYGFVREDSNYLLNWTLIGFDKGAIPLLTCRTPPLKLTILLS